MLSGIVFWPLGCDRYRGVMYHLYRKVGSRDEVC